MERFMLIYYDGNEMIPKIIQATDFARALEIAKGWIDSEGNETIEFLIPVPIGKGHEFLAQPEINGYSPQLLDDVDLAT